MKERNGSDLRQKSEAAGNNSGLSPIVFLVITAFTLNGCTSAASSECVDVALGTVQLRIPQHHLTPTTPRNSGSGNFVFEFNANNTGNDCQAGCRRLFVNISSTRPTPEQVWKNLAPKYTGRQSGNYRVFLSRYDWESQRILREILVPIGNVQPQDEFYGCDLEDKRTPLCDVWVTTPSGLNASFWLPRKDLAKARDAAELITRSINQFSINHKQGTCK